LRRRIPNLPIIVDPSHIGGKRDLILDISQRAIDLNFDGLIIESHCNPDEAWSDAKQQVTPAALKSILAKLILRHADLDKKQASTLEELRAQIDKFDDEILNIFEERMKIAEQIGKFKKDNSITILQASRWDTILKKRTAMGQPKGLSEEFVTTIFTAIHQESINHQTKVMNEE
jgi:chorismate mutase